MFLNLTVLNDSCKIRCKLGTAYKQGERFRFDESFMFIAVPFSFSAYKAVRRLGSLGIGSLILLEGDYNKVMC